MNMFTQIVMTPSIYNSKWIYHVQIQTYHIYDRVEINQIISIECIVRIRHAGDVGHVHSHC